MLEKVEKTKEVLKEAERRFNNLLLLWTGGKDSTTLLHIAKQTINTDVAFIDTGVHFPEIYEFIEKIKAEWEIPLLIIKQNKVFKNFKIAENKFECCKLLKTFPLHELIRKHRYEGVITAIRWDESEARKDEVYFSPRSYKEYPEYNHVRVHPMLHWRLTDIWTYIRTNKIPYCSLYDRGYASLDCEPCTKPSREERGGRMEKEDVMKELRRWG
jgi:phosphoadenosine phosphosulfate reductase